VPIWAGSLSGLLGSVDQCSGSIVEAGVSSAIPFGIEARFDRSPGQRAG
jgi:hypothetical protein